jgi:hypothetical protein
MSSLNRSRLWTDQEIALSHYGKIDLWIPL